MPPHLATFRDDLEELKAYGEGLLVELQCQQQAIQSHQVARMPASRDSRSDGTSAEDQG